MRFEVLIVPVRGEPVRIPVLMNTDSVLVAEAAGRPTPRYVFANASDYAYALVQLDPLSVKALESDLGNARDSFLRAQLWGAMWDQVRDALLSPERFIKLVLRDLPRERDEQIVSGVVGRLARAVNAYATPVVRTALRPDVERMLLAGANDVERTYGVRKAMLDAWIAVVGTAPGVGLLDGMLDSAQVVGGPLGAPTRWAMVARLVELGAPSATRRLDAETQRDATPEGMRRAFAARAATPDSATKARYFAEYFSPDLNEDWVTSSLDAFNASSAEQLTLPFLRSALDSLPWIQQNRRIFFVGSWVNAFVGGQSSPEALQLVRSFLSERTNLAADLRAKILQATDELERTIRIRRAFGINPI
jgi:aminopeptidase N